MNLFRSTTQIAFLSGALLIPSAYSEVFLGQGTMSGEVTTSSAFIQTRLTSAMELNDEGDLPGAAGNVAFEWATKEDFSDSKRTKLSAAVPQHDFIVRDQLTNLTPNTRYYYRALYSEQKDSPQTGPTCTFQTLPGENSAESIHFIIGSCMNYNRFFYGKEANASGPTTATAEDKRLGFPAFAAMKKLQPDFFVGTGDIVYYDNRNRMAETLPELRRTWHEQFRFQRLREFFQEVPTYWSKDDHDFRYNDADNTKNRKPLPQTGIDLFKEQLPIGPMKGDGLAPYRTYRINKNLQIWFTEGRDFRSPNKMKDGPDKTLWGIEQREWLKKTIKESDAKWKLLITPTPMVGPDDSYKSDNHVNTKGFRHEADSFFQWIEDNKIDNLMSICGDRHWQYHSIHPTGFEEVSCGALNDENSRLGVLPGAKKGTDPKALIEQPYTAPTPRGGFLSVKVADTLTIEFYTAQGEKAYELSK